MARKKYLTFLAVLAATAGAGFIGMDYLKDVREDFLYATRIADIRKASGIENISNFSEKLDSLRVFINDNSQHLIDDEFYANWEDKTRLADAFLDGLAGKRKDLPHMECATRAQLMADILKSRGIRVRSIDLYHDGGDTTLAGHVVIDALNPDTGKWETQDPDYDVYWKNIETNERATMLESALDLNAVQPCNRAGKCGWSLKNAKGSETAALKELTAYITVIDRTNGERFTFHRTDIKEDAIVRYDGKTGPYCDVIKKNCADGFMPATKITIKKALD